MDLGLKGRRALVCAASKGLGRACALALAQEGVAVTLTARDAAALAQTAAEIARETGAQITVAPGDIATPQGRAAALAICPDPDILVNNCGGPPPGDFRDWGRDDWLKALDANMLAPIEMMKATVDGMAARGFGRVVNITSAQVKAPTVLQLGLSAGARGGLTGFVAVLARQIAGRGVTVNNLLPGTFATDRLKTTLAKSGQAAGRSYEQEAAARTATVPAGRFGDPAEFAAACAFLCSVQAAYLTGQNIVIDGGAFPGTF
jgi:3-oxoacyl-[acyl-carrier protein] reductase